MRNSLFLVCLLGIPCASVAQSGQSSWANLSGLRAGQKIEIDEMSSKKHSGIFENVSDSAISIRDSSGEMSIQKQDVRRVKLLSGGHRLRNTLICAGVGVGGGAIAGAALGETQKPGFDIVTKGELTAAGAVGGGVIGTVIGVLLPAHDTIYRVSSH
jgi:hypothetical protein